MRLGQQGQRGFGSKPYKVRRQRSRANARSLGHEAISTRDTPPPPAQFSAAVSSTSPLLLDNVDARLVQVRAHARAAVQQNVQMSIAEEEIIVDFEKKHGLVTSKQLLSVPLGSCATLELVPDHLPAVIRVADYSIQHSCTSNLSRVLQDDWAHKNRAIAQEEQTTKAAATQKQSKCLQEDWC